MLVAKDIQKKIGDKILLKNISIELKPGEISVILGPSGCGKTTLLRTLCLLDFPDNGSILIEKKLFSFPAHIGQEVRIYPAVSIVFQQLFLWQHLSLRENIEFPLRENGKTREEITAIVNELTELLELGSFIESLPNQSSVGQKQRIAIARTLALNPQYLLLDEITSALDIVQTNKLVKIILSLVSKKNIAVLFVTHNVEVARKIADKILFMDKGTIIESGDVSILDYPKTEQLKLFLS